MSEEIEIEQPVVEEAVRDREGRTERYFLAVGFTMVSFLMIVAGLNYLDYVYGFIGLDSRTYQLSRMLIIVILAFCAGISISKGLIAGGVLMLVTTISCGSFVLASFLDIEHSTLQDPFLSILLFIVAYFFLRRKDIFLGIATLLFGIALLVPLFLEGDLIYTFLGVGLFISGVLYAVFCSATITEGETGIIRFHIGSVFRHTSIRGVAMNPYEMAVPISSVFSGMLMLFISVFYLYDGITFEQGDELTAIMFTTVISILSVYLCLKNIIAEGLFHLLLSLELVSHILPPLLGLNALPVSIELLILAPSLSIVILCFKRHDPIFAMACLLFFLCLALNVFGDGYIPSDSLTLLYGSLEFAAGLFLMYHGLARWFLVATRRVVLPLFTKNIVRTETVLETPPAMFVERKEWSVTNITATDLGNLFMAALLIWAGLYYLNSIYEFAHIDAHGYLASKMVLASVVMLFTFVSFARGAVTEALVYLLTGLSVLDFALLELAGFEGSPVADNVFGLFLLIASLFYFKRGHPAMGSATMLYAIGISAPSIVHGDLGNTVLALMFFVSGALYGYSALRRFVLTIQHKPIVNPARNMKNDMLGISKCPYDTVVALGNIMLAILFIIIAALSDKTVKSAYVMIHSTVVMVLGLYAIDKKLIAEGFSLLLPGMVLFMNGACIYQYGEYSPQMFWIFMSLMLLPTIAVFFINKDRLSGVSNTLILVAMFGIGITSFGAVYLFLIIAAVLIIFNAFNNWIIIERGKSILSEFNRHMAPEPVGDDDGNNETE